MKEFYSSIREYASSIINFEKKKKLSLAKKELKSHQDATMCCICRGFPK